MKKALIITTVLTICVFIFIVVHSFFFSYPIFINQDLFDIESFEKKNYHKNEIILFSDIAFDKYHKLRKWNNDIKVEVILSEEITEKDIADVDSCIAILTPLLYPLKIERVNSGGNLLVYMKQDHLPSKDGSGLGLCNTNHNSIFKRNITKAQIYEINYLYNKNILLHEFEHAIGLSHAKGKYLHYMNMYSPDNPYVFKSIEENDSIAYNRFPISEQEKQIIKMLYSSDFKSGLDRRTFNRLMNID